jgi:glutamate racemase
VPAADPRERPIAVFDSGVGGLTVLHELLVSLPHEDFLYLGDSARFPYGNRTPEELQRFAMDIADELVARHAKLLVVACNSMTAAALPALVERMRETTLGVDVIGVVRPEAAQAVAATRTGRIGLLATPTTVASGAYAAAVTAVDPHVDLISVPCPDLAPLIEEPPGGELFTAELQEVVRGYCAPLIEAGVDTVILGCTHYPLVRPMIQRMLGRGVTIVTSGAALARQAEHALHTRGLSAPRDREGSYAFLCTGDVEAFRRQGTRFLQMPITSVEAVALASTSDREATAWPRP